MEVDGQLHVPGSFNPEGKTLTDEEHVKME
jgi:hypothetical protein